MQDIDGIRVWGDPDPGALEQARRCAWVGDVAATALMADHHLGYSMPIGGVVGYRDMVSPSGVGFDIGCGVKAVRTDLVWRDVRAGLPRLLDDVAAQVSFGMGQRNKTPVEHPVMESPLWRDVPKKVFGLKQMAANQLGTVGSGNHYVDVLVEGAGAPADDAPVWVATHFGSRGLGHKTATYFLDLAGAKDGIHAAPALLDRKSSPELYAGYLKSMELAGAYAAAGRDVVVDVVLRILGARATDAVHNHHNYAWEEEHDGEQLLVVRKGATPAFPGQRGFVGGSMGDVAAIVRGVDTEGARLSLRSTVHGAGRVMSRSAARGKVHRKTGAVVREPKVLPGHMRKALKEFGVVVRGGDVDESPFVYRKLTDVLDAHEGTVEVEQLLRPVGVVMAGKEVFDPYKD